jgi:hypothetical protein
MSRGDLQEMEVGTKQSKTAVNANAKAAESMPHMTDPGTQLGNVEDLGGPDPSNYRPDDDSAKLKTPGATLKQVRDVVNRGAKGADAMKGLRKEDADYDEDEELLEAKHEEEEDEEEDEEEEKGKKKEKMEEQIDIEEDVNALLGGEELSEEFKQKAKTIFEAALKSKVSEIKEALEFQYEEKLVEEVELIKEALAERVDSYLEYVADEWFTENELVVEQGLKTEMTESFLSGMKELFEAHYVSIPEDKYDVLESMVEKLDDMETKLNEQIEKNILLNNRLAESVADGIFDEISEGLAATQKEKLASLAESVEFESEEEYREKLEMLKESYFIANKSPKAHTETLSEGVDHSTESISGPMAAYLRTLQAVAKN